MTESEQATYELFRSLSERAAVAEREAVVLQQQLTAKQAEARDLRARAKVYATELGLVC